MKYIHDEDVLRSWKKMSFARQMANVGAEVGRAIKWKNKGNAEYSDKAYKRGLELLMLTKMTQTSFPRIKEAARVYELLVDYFQGGNIYSSSDQKWEKYFYPFNFLAAKKSAKKN